MDVLTDIYLTVFAAPLRRLYMHGPERMGFWSGKPSSHICASMTGVQAAHWVQHPGECTAMIDRDVQSFLVVIETVTYFVTLYALLKRGLAVRVAE